MTAPAFVTDRKVKPWHNAPTCPKCATPVATPQLVDVGGHAWDGRNGDSDPAALFCPACGHTWIEADAIKVAQAWWSHGAHIGKEEG